MVAGALVATARPTPALADMRYLTRDRDTLVCVDVGYVDCSVALCDEGCGQLGACASGCHYGPRTAGCCDADDDCTIFDVAGEVYTGGCEPISGLSTADGSPVLGVCTYGPAPGATYCGASDVLDIYTCVMPGNEDWGAGDCDGDGLDNAADPDPCTGLGAPDGGMGFDDGGAADAAAPLDAGGPDGATRDASSGADSGSTRPPAGGPELVFRGGGGCACRAGDGLAPRPLALALALGIAVAARRRR